MNFKAFHRILASAVLLLSLASTTVDVQADIHNFTVDVTTDLSDNNLDDDICADAAFFQEYFRNPYTVWIADFYELCFHNYNVITFELFCQ